VHPRPARHGARTEEETGQVGRRLPGDILAADPLIAFRTVDLAAHLLMALLQGDPVASPVGAGSDRAVDGCIRPVAIDVEESNGLRAQQTFVGHEILERHPDQHPDPAEPFEDRFGRLLDRGRRTNGGSSQQVVQGSL
jgi:hypothetical protein